MTSDAHADSAIHQKWVANYRTAEMQELYVAVTWRPVKRLIHVFNSKVFKKFKRLLDHGRRKVVRNMISPRRVQMATLIMVMSLIVQSIVTAVEAGELADNMETDQMESGLRMIVVIGASYAGGWNPDRAIAGSRIVNKGVGGQQSFEMLARFETDVLALKPYAVIIWGFMNDVFRSERGQIDQTLKRTRESILAMVASAKKSGIEPILATEVTIRGKDGWSEALQSMIGRVLGKSSYQDYINLHVVETNRWIRDTATREGILLLDVEAVLADRHHVRRKEFAQPDGSHISNEGYEALSRYADDRLKALRSPEKT